MLVPERLKTYDLRKLGNTRKVSKPHRIISQCPVVNTSKTSRKTEMIFFRGALFHMKTRVVSNILAMIVSNIFFFFASNRTQTPSNLISLTLLVILNSLTQFQSKIRAIKVQKSAKTCLTCKYFPDIFTEVEIGY